MAIETTVYPPSEEDILRADKTIQEVVEGTEQPLDPSFFRRSRRWALPLLLTGTLFLVMACNPAKAVEPTTKAVATSTATASPTPEPPPTPEPTKAPPAPTAEPTIVITPEAEKVFDCGIFTPGVCEKADYITWGVPGRKPQEGIGVILDAGEKLKLPETMIVAASESATRPGNRRIAVVRKDGSQINIHGDITPVGDIGRVGKELPAGTIFAQVEGSGAKFIGEYTLVILFTNEEDLKKYFPKQTENPPRVVEIDAAPQSQAANQQGGGLVFFGVQPPQSK